MTDEADDQFYDRADAIIHLANEQIEDVRPGKVSASLMYATARFNAWVSALGFDDEAQMKEARERSIAYFVTQYRAMLEENFDDYIGKFSDYMKPDRKTGWQ